MEEIIWEEKKDTLLDAIIPVSEGDPYIPSSILLAMKHGKVLTPYACISDD